MSDADSPLRFVVLRHEGIPEPHFDLMFESEPGGRLVTWRSPVWPLEDQTRLFPLGEHRREYLEYEGAISGARGTVHRVASGTFEWVNRDRPLIRLLEPELGDWLIQDLPDGRALAVRA